MTTNTLAKLAAELAQLASEGPALIHLQSGAYICRKLGESAKALAAQALPAAEPKFDVAYMTQLVEESQSMTSLGTAEYSLTPIRLAYVVGMLLKTTPQAAQQAAQATAGWPASLTTAALKQSGATMESAAAHLESLPKMHQGKLLAHDLRRAASCCETAIESIQQATQPQAARTTEGI